MTYPFDSSYEPPIPSLEIHLSVPDQETTVGPLPGIVDTGADGTIIPLSYLNQLMARTVDDAWIGSHWGEWRPVLLYMVDLRVESITIPGLDVVADDQGNEISLGRNCLNRLYLSVNGPAAITKILRT